VNLDDVMETAEATLRQDVPPVALVVGASGQMIRLELDWRNDYGRHREVRRLLNQVRAANATDVIMICRGWAVAIDDDADGVRPSQSPNRVEVGAVSHFTATGGVGRFARLRKEGDVVEFDEWVDLGDDRGEWAVHLVPALRAVLQ
jgi:hypothetical protein